MYVMQQSSFLASNIDYHATWLSLICSFSITRLPHICSEVHVEANFSTSKPLDAALCFPTVLMYDE